jgi:hypothetical protein
VALAAAALTVAPVAARAEVERFGVFVGNDRGASGEVELRYAEADADKVQATLTDLGGFRPENTLLLRGEDAGTVSRALIAMNERVRAARSSGHDALLLVYYSGHADADALHLGDSRLESRVVEQLVKGSSAEVRLLVIDACRSGRLTRAKGGRIAPQVAIHVSEPLASEGLVVLTSSSASEDSQESDEIRGSFFTHHLVSGLLGAADVDGDGRVSLVEVYRYAYEQTLRVTSGTLAVQHPSFRYDVRGQGELILTRTRAGSGKRGWLTLPAARGYLVFAGSRSGPLAAEVPDGATSRTISLPAGRYFLRGRAPTYLVEGDVVVERGAVRTVSERELARLDYGRLVRKGSGLARADALVVSATARTALVDTGSLCVGGYGGYAADFHHVTAVARVGGCAGRHDNDALSATDLELGGELALAHAWDRGRLTAEVSLMAGGGALIQRFDGASSPRSRTSAFGAVGGGAALSARIAARSYLRLGIASHSYFFRQLDSETMSESVNGRAAVRVELGFGRHF